MGSHSLEDGSRESRSETSPTPKTIEKVHDIVLSDMRVKVNEITEAMDIRKKGCETSCTKNYRCESSAKHGCHIRSKSIKSKCASDSLRIQLILYGDM
ncbi:hypothetical protein TNCV_4271171 [Trichonephila clavipes]|nr:hypothetical protein TNCV_4271171 [Trichonephila clavipes]